MSDGDCIALQNDELQVLESIYPNLVSIQPNPSNKPGRSLNLSIPIALSSAHDVVIGPNDSDAPSSSSSSQTALSLSHLPPLSVKLLLPPCYPTAEPPRAVAIKALLPDAHGGRSWLQRKQLSVVQDKLRSLWEEDYQSSGEGSGVIWRWWDWLGSGEFLHDLGLMDAGRIRLPLPPGMTSSTYYTVLKTFDASQIHSSFEKTAFSCSICLENRKGKSCIQMPICGCIFCTPCLSSCWTLAIEEGTLENVSCPSVSCVKTRATSTAKETETDSKLVEEVVGETLRDRWLSLKDKRKAEIDPSYTICPRPTCQAAVPPPALPSAADLAAQSAISSRAIRLSDISKPASSSYAVEPASKLAPAPTDDRWARYRICPTCQYSFCLYCSTTWHGPHTPCAFPQTSALVQEYLSYEQNSPQRRAMEARRGKTNLERLVAKHLEDEANRQWLQSSTRACAGCGVRVEKSHGCNHMTCGRCNAHFCYRCGDSISPQDPYAHFRRPGHACYNKLFDMEEIERFERETAAGIAGIQLADDAEDWREVRGIWEW